MNLAATGPTQNTISDREPVEINEFDKEIDVNNSQDIIETNDLPQIVIDVKYLEKDFTRFIEKTYK